MRLLTAIFILLAFPASGFAQSFSGEQVNKSNKSVAFHPDPFKTYMLKAKNPCNNPDYESGDRLAPKNSAIYEQKVGGCQDYISVIDQSRPDRQTEPEQKPQPIEPYYYYIVGGSILVAVGVIFILH